MARRDATQEVGLTLEEKAAKALAHVERAAAALRGPPAIFLARSELAKALDVLLQAEDDPYASTTLRPGLNKPAIAVGPRWKPPHLPLGDDEMGPVGATGPTDPEPAQPTTGAMGQEEYEAWQESLKSAADA